MSEPTQPPLDLDGEPGGPRSRSSPLAGEGGWSTEDFRRIFEWYRPRILRFFCKRSFSAAEAEELTQDTFLRAYRASHVPTAEGELLPWLVTVAANVRRNALRDRNAQKRTGHESSLEEQGEELLVAGCAADGAARSDTPLDAFLGCEQGRILRQAVAELPAQMRRCLIHRHFHELEYKEIAVLMNISIQTVKAHLYQGRQRLHKVLGRRLGEPDLGR